MPAGGGHRGGWLGGSIGPGKPGRPGRAAVARVPIDASDGGAEIRARTRTAPYSHQATRRAAATPDRADPGRAARLSGSARTGTEGRAAY